MRLKNRCVDIINGTEFIHTDSKGKVYVGKVTYKKNHDYIAHGKHCPCGKDVYLTYDNALKAFRQRNKQRDKQKDVYHCEICGFYHLTSRDGKPARKNKYNTKERRKPIRYNDFDIDREKSSTKSWIIHNVKE